MHRPFDSAKFLADKSASFDIYTNVYSAINVHLNILNLIHIMSAPEKSVRGASPDNVVCFTQTDTQTQTCTDPEVGTVGPDPL